MDSLMSLAKLNLEENNRTGLQTKFDTLRKNIELTDNQLQKIITSHSTLRMEIEKLPYVQKTFLTGSYKKNTMIRPPNDVDIFVVLTSDQASLNPQSILDKLKRDISSVALYKNSTIRQDRPCVVVDLAHCKFELTPTIQPNSIFGGYKIPQKKLFESGLEWFDISDPNIFGTKLAQRNSELGMKLIPLIKMMKKLKEYCGISNIKSFQMEEAAFTHLQSIASYRDGVQQLMKIYNWSDPENPNYHYWLSNLSDEEFAKYCRNTLFGTDFPE